jgi:hypothetical protein
MKGVLEIMRNHTLNLPFMHLPGPDRKDLASTMSNRYYAKRIKGFHHDADVVHLQ